MRILADIALLSIGAVIGVVTVCFAQCAGRADREMEKMMWDTKTSLQPKE